MLVRATGSDLSYLGVGLHELEAHVDFDPLGKGMQTSMRLDQLRISNRVINRASFTTNGTAAAHRFVSGSSAPRRWQRNT